MVANRNIQLDRIRLRTPVIFLVLASQQEELIAKLDREVNEQTCHFAAQIDRLDAVPGGRSPRGRGGVGGSGSRHEAVPNT